LDRPETILAANSPGSRSTRFSPQALRHLILEESHRANVGHIGSALSVVDIVVALYGNLLRVERWNDPDRDRFVLGKGHAALAVYAALYLLGRLERAELSTYCTDDSRLGVHPSTTLPGIDFSTGSLGHALSFGVGAALAARMQRSKRRVFVLLSDAECNEGSTWEAVMFSAHHSLHSLVALVDVNGQQALGHCHEVLDQTNATERWRAFGWQVKQVDGHNPQAIIDAINAGGNSKPLVILARTISGRGVSFMEGQVRWHYMPMSDSEYRQALDESDTVP
jgi:transketolase